MAKVNTAKPDQDRDGKPDLDADKVESTLAALVELDHALRDKHGLSLAVVLAKSAGNIFGVKL